MRIKLKEKREKGISLDWGTKTEKTKTQRKEHKGDRGAQRTEELDKEEKQGQESTRTGGGGQKTDDPHRGNASQRKRQLLQDFRGRNKPKER